MLALLLWQTKIVFTGGAFLVNVGFFVTLFAFLQITKALQLVEKLDQSFVFLLSFVNIS